MGSSEDPFAVAARDLRERIEAHDETRATQRYEGAQKHLQRLVQDFVLALRVSWVAFTRDPRSDNWLLQNSVDDLLESAIGLPVLTRDGIFNVARRELRYMLEAAVKYVYVDQQLPPHATLEDRIQFLGDNTKVPRSSIDPIANLTLRMVDNPEDFRDAVKSSFSALSGYVHPSQGALKERFVRVARGEFTGFEGPKVLEAFNRLVSQTLDLVLVLNFEGIGPAFSGDVFIQIFDETPGWKFHRTKFTPQVSRYFDYKVERQSDSAS
jgi:hypothetical protein